MAQLGTALHLAGLTGKAASVQTAVACETVGKIPFWLGGSLYRNGPGIFDVTTKDGKTATVPHWFDGLTLLHEFTFDAGAVTYRNRYLYPQLEKYMKEHGRLPGTFAGDPCQSLFGAAMSWMSAGVRQLLRPSTSVSEFNIGVTIGHIQGDRLVSKTDFNGLVEVEPQSLDPKPMFSYTDINPEFKGYFSAAHGQYDPSTRQYYNYTLDFPIGALGAPTYHLFCIPDGDPSGYLLATLRADAAYIHSFAMTERFVVFIVWPALLSVLRLALVGSPAPALSWHPEKGAKMYVIDRRKGGPGHVATYSCPAFFCFHTINSFEEGGALHIDLCGYDDMALLKDLYMNKLRSGQPSLAQGTIRRYTLPDIDAAAAAGPRAAARPAEVRVLCDGRGRGAELFDLPRFNKALALRPYSYVYCTVKSSQQSSFFDGLAKVDIGSGEMVMWQQEGHFPGEPIFVAAPNSTSEDDGVLLSVVLQGGAQPSSFLLVLDAKTMREVGRALAPNGMVVPFGFHGQYMPTHGVSSQLD